MPAGEPTPAAEVGSGSPVVVGGVVGSGMGGNDSSSDAPNDEVGLNGLKPEKPVAWG